MSLALSGGINVFGEFPGETRGQFIDGLTTFLLMAGWTMDAKISATVTGTYAGQPSNGDHVSVGGFIYTFKTVVNNAVFGDVLIDATLTLTLANLVAAINLAAGAGTKYSTLTTINTQCSATSDPTHVVLISRFKGPLGNGTPSTYGPLLFGGYKVKATSPQTNLTGGGGGASSGLVQARAYVYDQQETDAFGQVYANVKVSSVDETLASNEKTIRVVPPIKISGATNASPIVIATATNHGLSTGANVKISNVGGNTHANGTWLNVVVLDASHIQLPGSSGNGTYAAGTGILRPIVAGIAGRRFRVIANRCQFFCYVPGVAADVFGSVISGGVPWFPPSNTCNGEVPSSSTTLGYWLGSDRNPLGDPATTHRTSVVLNQHYTEDFVVGSLTEGDTSILNDAEGWINHDAAYNTQVTLGGDAKGTFKSLSLTPNYANNFLLFPGIQNLDSVRWSGNGDIGRGMLLEPLVEWAPFDSSHSPMVRGQLWDAWIGTDQQPMDTVSQFADGRHYCALTNQGKFGTLWLIVPSPTPLQLESIVASYAH
jgi:hypothetical protein